ncbi:MAG: hypothetical protein C4527_29490 [Candidatus Omnitrophota bacterium]|jgi:hypothetical protein|nr:MAG: hypothetical protein C4527_29490 [Candidatus Omnitrophota bacterium]
MKKATSIFCVAVVAACLFPLSVCPQDRFINCRKFDASIKIVIDGDKSDWPISSFGSPAAIDSRGDLTTGDHFVLNAGTAAYDNQGTGNVYSGPADFDAVTYIGWDNQAFYLLNIARDNEIGFDHARAGTIDANGYLTGSSTGWTNDGIELWLDNDNDRLPLHLDQQPEGNSVNDLQFNVIIDDALQRRDYPNLAEEDYGLRFDNFYYQYKEIFRSGADYNDGDALEYELLSTIDTVTKLDADNKGYTMEIRIPFGSFVMFESTHPIGFNLSWLDWDKGEFSHFSWNGFPSEQPEFYQEMRFTSDRPLGGTSIGQWSIY